MRRNNLLFWPLLMGSVLGAFPQPTQAREEAIVSIAVGSDSLGVQPKRLEATFRKLFELASNKTGFPIKLEILPGFELGPSRGTYGDRIIVEEAVKRLKAGTTDIVYPLYPEDYFLHPQLKALVSPAYSWTIQKKDKGRTCLYVNSKRGFQSFKDLKGRSINNLIDYVTIRHLLSTQGVNTPLWKFFGKVHYEYNPVKGLELLTTNKVDAVYMSWQKWLLASKQRPAFRDIKPMGCLENQPLVMLGVRKGFDQSKFKLITNILVSAHRDPHMTPIKWFFAAFNGQFFAVPPAYLKNFETMFQKANKAGWVKEAMVWYQTESPRRYKTWMQNPHP